MSRDRLLDQGLAGTAGDTAFRERDVNLVGCGLTSAPAKTAGSEAVEAGCIPDGVKARLSRFQEMDG